MLKRLQHLAASQMGNVSTLRSDFTSGRRGPFIVPEIGLSPGFLFENEIIQSRLLISASGSDMSRNSVGHPVGKWKRIALLKIPFKGG